MKNGTNAAVLVSELLEGDGPAAEVAEDFIALRCSDCSRRDLDDMRFGDGGYLCGRCGSQTSTGDPTGGSSAINPPRSGLG